MARFMIHLIGAPYSNSLYDSKGRDVFTLEDAKEAAFNAFPDSSWEVYNGSEAYTHTEPAMDDDCDDTPIGAICPKCGRYPASPPHACPYESEINNNNDENYCTCCSKCEHECAMDI